MSHEEHRVAVTDLKFPRHTLVSLLVFVVCWEVLSHLAPTLGIPAFAIPSFVKIAKSFANITAADIELSDEELREIETGLAQITPEGARYSESLQRMIDR